MIVVAAFEAPALVAVLDDVAVVGEAVEERGGHLGVAEGEIDTLPEFLAGDEDESSAEAEDEPQTIAAE